MSGYEFLDYGLYNGQQIQSLNTIDNDGDTLGQTFGHFLDINGFAQPLTNIPFGDYTPQGINDALDVVGVWIDQSGNEHGFVNGTSFDDPDARLRDGLTFTQAAGINDSGAIVGEYYDGTTFDGFLDVGGTFTSIIDPSAASGVYAGTRVTGINNAGVVFGTYWDQQDAFHGFVDTKGTFTTIDDPLAAGAGASQGTYVTGVNDAGEIVGFYRGPDGIDHGFIDNGGVFTTVDHPGDSGTNGTTLLGINDAGDIVGTYQDSGENSHGFLMAQPAAGPATPPAANFTGSGNSDVLFQNTQTGAVTFAVMNNGTFGNFGAATPNIGTIAVVGHGDVNGDGFSDVVVQDPSSGRIYIAEQNGSGTPNWVLGPETPGYMVVGVGDINGDGWADIVIQNASGNIAYLDTKDSPNPNDLSINPDLIEVANTPGFNVVGLGDINGAKNGSGNGYADIVLQNPTTGEIDYINMTGGVNNGFVAVGRTPNWTVKAVGDLNGDGFADIVVQDTAAPGTEPIEYANMHGGVLTGWNIATPVLPASYVAADVADIKNDGFTDLILQDQSTGATYCAEQGPLGFIQQDPVTGGGDPHFHVV